MATYSIILAWRIPWTEELGGLQSMGLQTVGHDWATNTFFFSMESTPNWRVYCLVSQGNSLNVSTGSLLFKPIKISLSHDKNCVLREYDWASGILKSSLGGPPKHLLSCWPKTCSGSHHLLSKHIYLAPPPSGLIGGRGLADLIASPQRQGCCLGRWTTSMLTLK